VWWHHTACRNRFNARIRASSLTRGHLAARERGICSTGGCWAVEGYLAHTASPFPQGQHRALGVVPPRGPRGWHFLLSKVPPWETTWENWTSGESPSARDVLLPGRGAYCLPGDGERGIFCEGVATWENWTSGESPSARSHRSGATKGCLAAGTRGIFSTGGCWSV